MSQECVARQGIGDSCLRSGALKPEQVVEDTSTLSIHSHVRKECRAEVSSAPIHFSCPSRRVHNDRVQRGCVQRDRVT